MRFLTAKGDFLIEVQPLRYTCSSLASRDGNHPSVRSAALHETADGSYTGTKKVTEKALADFLTHVFKFTPDRDAAGKLTIGMVELDPSAKTVSRGKAACLLGSSLSAFEDSMGAAGAAADKRLAAAEKAGAAPKPVPAAPPAKMNLQQIINGMNAPNLKYKTGAGELAPEGRVSLVEIATYMKRLPAGTTVEVGVHTDSNGNEDSNVNLAGLRTAARV